MRRLLTALLGTATSVTIQDGEVTAVVGVAGLERLDHLAVDRDGFRVVAATADGQNVTCTDAAASNIAQLSPAAALLTFDCPPLRIDATYEARGSFVSKTLNVTGADRLWSVAPWAGVAVAGVAEFIVATNPYQGDTAHYAVGDLHLAAFGRLENATGVFLSVANPFFKVAADGKNATLAFDAGGAAPEDGSFVAEPGVVGVTRLEKYAYDDVNLGERRAFVACVESYLLDAPRNESVKVNVAWDESDYQIDVAAAAGRDEYARIFDTNAALGITHIVYEPQNTLHGSRFNTTDGWGWEGSLWFSMGERVREDAFDFTKDDVPSDILDAVASARAKGLGLLGYVYPQLGFQAMADHLYDDRLDISPPEVRTWLGDQLEAFLDQTGAAGFAWDHDIYAGPSEKMYAQWRSWMAILKRLRAHKPDIVMDHRQTNHIWGPWYQLAGSYAEPLAGDENPETYGVPLPSLHADHVAGNNLRIVNHRYAREQLQPPARLPGFAFHQTERTDDNGTDACFGGVEWCWDSNARDFDLVGYKFSLLSSIGTAGLNNVFAMVPARDAEEWSKIPDADKAFIKNWLAWTDAHLTCLGKMQPVATLGVPAWDGVDGFACVDGDEGFVFLFNPGPVLANASLVLDESLGLANGTASAWNVTELYPRDGAGLGSWASGEPAAVEVGAADARVLELSRADDRATDLPKTATTRNMPLPETTISRNMPIAPDAVAPPTFRGGWFNVSFAVPDAVRTQLDARAAAYDVNWRANEYNATWLVPQRLLVSLTLETPTDDLDVVAELDGAPLAVAKSYNSRGLQRSRCFLGSYVDLSSLDAATHVLSVRWPALDAGRFRGVFFENVETVYE